MPACTGLPPGLLMRSTMATEPASLKALLSEGMTESAEPLPSDSMLPSISISAVCLPSASMSVPVLKSKYAHSAKLSTPSTSSLKKMLQRRAARCSLTVANSSFSSVSRSQLALMGEVVEGHRPAGCCWSCRS